jgi:hypothetical protein
LSLPEPYRRFYRAHLRFALIMVFVSLVAGILFQESGKKVHLSEAVPVGAHLEYVIGLALVHGHAFLIGVLLPLAFTWALHLGLTLGFAPLGERSLRAATLLYLPSSLLAVGLMLLKSYHFVLGVRHGRLDFNLLNQSFLSAPHGLRAGLYGISHTLMAVGLGILAVGLWRSMGRGAKE